MGQTTVHVERDVDLTIPTNLQARVHCEPIPLVLVNMWPSGEEDEVAVAAVAVVCSNVETR